jgi:transketolase
MRSTSVRVLAELAKRDERIHFLTADLGFKVLDPYRDVHPTRFTNMGVAEALMSSVAAGMASSGVRPICYSMVPFLFMRAFEQIRVDVVAPKLPVILLGVGGGLAYGHEGMSHHAIEDVAMACALPGLTVVAPGDPLECEAALVRALEIEGPTYIRLGKNGDPKLHAGPIGDITRPMVLRESRKNEVVVLATGHILAAALEACVLLEKRGLDPRLVSVPTLKPFPSDAIDELTRGASFVFTVEEHGPFGGLGAQSAEVLLARSFKGKFVKLSLPDAYCNTHGSLEWLRKHYGLDPAGIAGRIVEHVG